MEKDGGGIRWIARGDVNAFFGLMLDNMTQVVILAGILTGVFGYSREIVLHRMVPGTAIGVLLGDLVFTWMAVRLARREGRSNVTAMPLGIDTPSLFGLTFGVLGPALLATGDETRAWQIGMAVMVIMGLVKMACAYGSNWVRRVVPRAGLLGSIAAVAILLIAFIPSLKIFAEPVVGFLSLAIVLVCLVARIALPAGFPGALLAVVLGAAAFYGLGAAGLTVHPLPSFSTALTLHLAVPLPTLGFADAFAASLPYLPIAIPFALATVVGGIDNTESAAAAGDEYSARAVVLTEGVATLVAGLCGGVIQTTPYIGHPAYKEMGGRAGYTLATALFIGLGGILGYLSFFVTLVPEAAVAPILIFIGIEICAQAFLASPPRHAPAVALSFVPVIASLLVIEIGTMLSGVGSDPSHLSGEAAATYHSLHVLSGGFIFSAVLWGGALALVIDGSLLRAASFMAVGALASLFGVIHSPRPGGDMFLPWRLDDRAPFFLAAGYIVFALVLLLFHRAGFQAASKEPSAGMTPPG
ncbi:MAG: MFS transporter [Deltaproteobacteria bacterium RBG_13_65_10]|nr:MAG: MFS transporter [Deltaproteobacteria bacterium RBG_13_65_10]